MYLIFVVLRVYFHHNIRGAQVTTRRGRNWFQDPLRVQILRLLSPLVSPLYLQSLHLLIQPITYCKHSAGPVAESRDVEPGDVEGPLCTLLCSVTP